MAKAMDELSDVFPLKMTAIRLFGNSATLSCS